MPKIQQSGTPVLLTSSGAALSMHIIEREHGHTRKDAEAARHLGHALGAPEVSAIHVLRARQTTACSRPHTALTAFGRARAGRASWLRASAAHQAPPNLRKVPGPARAA